jgi:hypothetical protein
MYVWWNHNHLKPLAVQQSPGLDENDSGISMVMTGDNQQQSGLRSCIRELMVPKLIIVWQTAV